MSLLDSGQVVSVYVEEEATDGDGNTVMRPSVTPVSVAGRWQYLVPSEDDSAGVLVGTRAEFLCRSFPAGYAGRVSYDGRDWDVTGEPVKAGLSALTTHCRVRLTARAPRPVV